MKEKIEIMIDKNGMINSDASNFNGSSCVDAVSQLMRDIALFVEGDDKPDFYEQRRTTNESLEVKNTLQ